MHAGLDAISVRGVHAGFAARGGDVAALSDIDLSVAEGEFVSLFGPSGCGKSTLLRIIAGLVQPRRGEVRLFGEAPAVMAKQKNIGWIPQSPALLPWLSVRANASLSQRINRGADHPLAARRAPHTADAMLAGLRLTEFADARPAALSGGMRQRAAIARGFVQGAAVILMDEPFSALDELTHESVRQHLLELWETHRRTVACVTHSASDAVLLSDRVVVMTPRPGRIHSILRIGLGRPRSATLTGTAEFAELVAELRRRLHAASRDQAPC